MFHTRTNFTICIFWFFSPYIENRNTINIQCKCIYLHESNHVVGSCFFKHEVEYKQYFIITALIIFALHTPSWVSWQSLLHNLSSTRLLPLVLLSVLFRFPLFLPLTFSRVFCSSRCPTAYPICPILCPGSALPAGHGQRLPEGRTGVATHTSLSTWLPVASGGRACAQQRANAHRHKHKGTLI